MHFWGTVWGFTAPLVRCVGMPGEFIRSSLLICARQGTLPKFAGRPRRRRGRTAAFLQSIMLMQGITPHLWLVRARTVG